MKVPLSHSTLREQHKHCRRCGTKYGYCKHFSERKEVKTEEKCLGVEDKLDDSLETKSKPKKKSKATLRQLGGRALNTKPKPRRKLDNATKKVVEPKAEQPYCYRQQQNGRCRFKLEYGMQSCKFQHEELTNDNLRWRIRRCTVCDLPSPCATHFPTLGEEVPFAEIERINRVQEYKAKIAERDAVPTLESRNLDCDRSSSQQISSLNSNGSSDDQGSTPNLSSVLSRESSLELSNQSSSSPKGLLVESKSPLSSPKGLRIESKSPLSSPKGLRVESKSPLSSPKGLLVESKSSLSSPKGLRVESKSSLSSPKGTHVESKSPLSSPKGLLLEEKSSLSSSKGRYTQQNTDRNAASPQDDAFSPRTTSESASSVQHGQFSTSPMPVLQTKQSIADTNNNSTMTHQESTSSSHMMVDRFREEEIVGWIDANDDMRFAYVFQDKDPWPALVLEIVTLRGKGAKKNLVKFRAARDKIIRLWGLKYRGKLLVPK